MVYHGKNVWDREHGEEHWQSSTESFRGGSYDLELRKLWGRLQLDLPDEG
jgi:hypothetical protein